MKKKDWKKIIEDQIKFDHEYIPSFQTTIQILSEMLEERDRIYELYLEDGARPVVDFTSDRGATNLKPNPLLRQWQEINTLCLSYLRDLGLTAAGLRKLQGQLPKERSEETLFKSPLLRELHEVVTRKQDTVTTSRAGAIKKATATAAKKTATKKTTAKKTEPTAKRTRTKNK